MEKQFQNYINKERLLQEFKNLVAIDSESYHEREMANYLLKRLREIGMEPVEDNAGELLREKSGIKDAEVTGNIIARLPKTKSKQNLEPLQLGAHSESTNQGRQPIGDSILFSSHMDTVVPGKNKKLVVHPDGKITSDGTTVLGADDLAGVAAILEMLQVIKENDFAHPEIEVLFPVAEEPYAQGSRVFDYSKLHAKQAYVLDLSGKVGTAAVAAPSMISFKIIVKGKSAHAGFSPEQGIHAIKIAAAAIAKIQNGHVDADTTVNFGLIQGGNARNIVPEEVIIEGEIRSMVQEKALEQVATIKQIFEEEMEVYLKTFVSQNVLQDLFETDVTNDCGIEKETIVFPDDNKNPCSENENVASNDNVSKDRISFLVSKMIDVQYIQEFYAYRIAPEEIVVQDFKDACQQLNLPFALMDTFGGSDNNHFTAHGIRGIVTACGMNAVHSKQEYTYLDEIANSAALILTIACHEIESQTK